MKNSKTNSSVEKQSNKKLTKKKNQSLTTFLNNLDFLEEHKKLFETIPINGNNSNLYFENNLRHYSHIKLKSLHSPSTDSKLKYNSRVNRSSVTLKEQAKQAVKKTEKRLKRSRLTQSRREFIEVILPPCETNETSQFFEDDTEEEVFYSANSVDSQSLNKRGHTKRILPIKSEESVKVSDKMAEGEEIYEDNEYLETEEEEQEMNQEGEGEDEVESPEGEQNIENPEGEGEGEEERGEGGSEGTDDDIRNIQEMINDASRQLEEITIEGEGDAVPVQPPPQIEGGSVFKFNPANDAALLQELDYAERQAKETAAKISVIKERLTELLKKEVCTEVEAKELEELNKELKALMAILEEKTRRIQFLTAQANLFENMIPPSPMLQIKRAEDALPKVIVCGLTEANMPKLIVCEDLKKKKKHRKSSPRTEGSKQLPVMQSTYNDYSTRQEIQRRCPVQTDARPSDQMIDNLQRKFLTMQNEMRNICQEHAALQMKINEFYERSTQQQKGCGKNKGICPIEMELRVKEYTEATKQLEQQLYTVENEMCNLQSELCAIQCERQQLERTGGKKNAICPPPICAPVCPPVCPSPADRELRELKEQYNRLQDDFKNKLTEVACLRADNEKIKQSSINGESVRRSSDERSRDYDRSVRTSGQQNSIGNREQLVELEQQMNVAKQRFREAQDELEELRALMQEQQAQINEYRNKYLETQQIVEEQRRQISILEMDTLRINEEINLDIQQVKNQFQQKLEELSPLPDLLKTTQMKLQETEQMYSVVEKNNEDLQRELQIYKEKIEEITAQADTDPNAQLRVAELENENDFLKNELERVQTIAEDNSREAQRNAHEIAQLIAQLDNVREESARQVARTKDRCEIVRRSMQNQIADLERQLAQSRAQSKSIQKERDEIRRMMQVQINNLNQNFQDAQVRIRSLQGHVEFLKEPPFNGGDGEFSEICGCGTQI